ncbi:lysozyme [Aurantiacibacter marinus]|uniref:Lysozyme n=1 Tax=Aurantiacibacter marinus TaxID=874156 RepID=A0A0H0XRX3_9SPHN|nr:lysozyme [Aurantiacibacter marinus]KLI65099.1 glycoside hydrolase [Aurantiacibacter marinus]
MDRKPLFDIIRRIIGRPFRQNEVDAIDRVLDRGIADPVTGGSGDASEMHHRSIGPDGIALIKRFEGCARRRSDGQFAAYPDPGTGADPWTIGWGATGKGIGPGTVWSQEQCDARLEADLVRYANDVDRALGDAPTSQSQFDAMVSFHYNTGAISKATLTRKHKAGDIAGAAREFDRWCYAGGRVMKGLVRRRCAESTLYRK